MQEREASPQSGGLGMVAATFTAFHPDGAVNLDAIERQGEELARQGLRGVFVCGTSGEFSSLTVPERMAIAQRWSEVVGSDLELIVHVGHTSLSDAQELAAHAERIGAAGIAAVGPYYFLPRDLEGVVAFSARIAGAAPATPFYYYHIPSNTRITLPVLDFMPMAAAAIPTFAGLKFTHDDLAEYVRCAAYEDGRYEVFFGRDEMILAAMAMGATSAVGSTYNIAAPLYRCLAAAFQRGDLTEARRWQIAATTMIDVAVAHGGLPAFKAMSRFTGVDCGPCRPPLVSLSETDVARLERALEDAGYFAALREAAG